MSIVKNVMSKLGQTVQESAEAVTQQLGDRVASTLDAAMQSKIGSVVGDALQKTIGTVVPGTDSESPWSRREFEKRLRAKGDRYHIHHPFNVKMRTGQLTAEQIRGWVANRFYYQIRIPQKDAAIMANCDDRETRRRWIQRIMDHDGWGNNLGGIEAWTRLGESVGIPREELWSLQHVLPPVRFAVDAYVNFARQAPWQEAICSSLTEMFAPEIHKERLANWPQHYKWIESSGLEYFRSRISLAKRDVEHGLEVTLDYFKTREQQERALTILQFKLDILWSILDAVQHAYPDGEDDSMTPEVDIYATPAAPPKRSAAKKAAAKKAVKTKTAKAQTVKETPEAAETPAPSSDTNP